MADISNDCHILHGPHMFDADNVFVAGCGDENIRAVDHIFQKDNFKAIHRSLQRTDRINFGNFHPRACAAQRGGRPLANIAIATDNGHFARHHRVGGATDAVDQRFLTAIFVVKLGFGHRVVDIDCRERQLPGLDQFI